jgi:arginine/lysine/ornithine decarboxylase
VSAYIGSSKNLKDLKDENMRVDKSREIIQTGIGKHGRDEREGEAGLIRGNLFSSHLMAMKITTQFVLTSNIKPFV